MTSGELREKIDLGRDMWHERRAAVLPVARVAAVLLGAAVVLGYVTAGDGGAVAPKPAPASTLEPAAGGTLRLRDVAIPEQLEAPPRRPAKKQDRQESNQTENQTPAQPAPSRPSGSGGGFDSVG